MSLMGNPQDNSWGAKDPITGQWGGVVGDVYKGKAHFTLADLAVTSARDEAVTYDIIHQN